VIITFYEAIKIGPGFYIGHFGTIVINSQTIIGENCNIAHLTTIGQINKGYRKGTPIIGNHVWIGTGAVIVGKITVGNNVLIAPNAYVNRDVPDNSLVIGNPMEIISKEDATSGYINYVFDRNIN
jgi:serine O-acetyltransferase